MTDGVLKLAEATGADLGEAAKVTGIALKAFGLSAISATDVAATLAIATTKSALSFGDFETALSTVGAVANAFGFKLEDTVALMGKLKDAGFDSSKASTALRNILLNLADSNGALAKKLGGSVKSLDQLIPALVKLKSDGVSLNETLQITDKRSVAAFNTLLNGADSVTVLRDAITGANDALDEMVTTKTDNTVDAMARMGSAWDGVVLTFRNSDGFFTGFFDKISDFMNSLTDEYTSYFDKYVSLWSVGLINLGADQIAERKKTTEELKKLDEIDLYNWVSFNKDKKTSTDKFERDLYQIAVERLAAIEEARQLAEKRNIDAIKQANKEMTADAEKIANKTSELFFTEEEKKLAAINKKADKLREQGLAEIDIARWVAQEIAKIKVKHERTSGIQAIGLKKIEGEIILTNEDILQKSITDIINKEAKIRQDEADAIQVARNAKELEEARLIAEAKRQLLVESVDAGFAIYQASLDRELISLNEKRDAELLRAGDDKAKQEQINKKFDAKEAAVKTKKAKADKTAALIQAAIQTALSIVKASPVVPLMILAAAVGALSIATIASQPIPKFFKGTDSAPGGLISVAEGNKRELIETKTGQLLMANKETVTSGLQGAKIYTNEQTERIMNHSGHDSPDIRETLDRNNNKLIKAIHNQKQITISRANRTITERKGEYYKTYMNAKISGF